MNGKQNYYKEKMMTNPVEQNDIKIGSWAELCERLYDSSWQDDIRRFRSNFAFRGLEDKAYPLANSFKRNCGERAELEYHLLRNFRKYSQLDDVDKDYSDWSWMTLAQHHGLPTRLLDWTYSPFIAMHFATSQTDKYESDGVVWAVNFVKLINSFPSHCLIDSSMPGANTFTIGMFREIFFRYKSI